METLVKFRKSIMFLLKLMIIISVTCGFVQTWNTYYIESLFSSRGNYVVIFSFVLIFAVFSNLYGAFNIGIYRIHEIIYSFSLSAVFTNIIMYLELSLIARRLVAVLPLGVSVVYQVFAITVSSCAATYIYFKLHPARTVVALFSDDSAGFNLIKKMGARAERFNVQCGINVEHSSFDEIKKKIDKYDAVVICDIDKRLQKQVISYCYTNNKRTYLLPDITDIVINNGYAVQIGDTPIILSQNRGLTLEQRTFKEIMDILISAIGIILTSPIMLITAIAIKLDDGGPVLFKQNRVTKGGKIFNILKFRSMIVDADKDGAKKAVNDDDRITRVGKVIRACRVDELPQLFNILKGDMSVVGPRPERIENVYEYSTAHPEFELRHRVKAGLTGYAQLYGKYNTTPEDKLNMDLIYIETYSILLDIKLLILTIKVLFMKESTEGFEESANKNVRKGNVINIKEENNDVI